MAILIALLLSIAMASSPEASPSASVLDRTYTLGMATGYQLDTPALAGPMVHRMAMDAYGYGIRPHLGPRADKVVGTAWSFAFTYTTVLWPHEFGHWSRANQVDSRFIFHNLNPILPYTTVEMPDDAPLADEALLSVGGFEVNNMVARQAQVSFYENGEAWSDEMAHALVNRMFFSIYAGIFPAVATEPNTWIETRGDPVHFVLPVYERATGRDPLLPSGEVDPELVSLYRESVALSLLWNALDPAMVQQLMAFGDGAFDHRAAWTPVSRDRFGWTWGTQFLPTPLGYALSLDQYFRIDERTVVLSAHMGRPMKNRGLRLDLPDLVETRRVDLGLAAEAWDQDDHGAGWLVEPSVSVRLSDSLELTGAGGYKTEGYVLGRAIEAGPSARVGLSYSFAHQAPTQGR